MLNTISDWGKLNSSLSTISGRHHKLQAHFNEFTSHAIAQITHNNFHIKGIKASNNTDESTFEVAFAGRQLLFKFSSVFGEDGTHQGQVKCYLKIQDDEQAYSLIGEFKFNGNGATDLADPTEPEEKLVLSYDKAALYIVLHYINEGALTKQNLDKATK